MQTKSQQRHGAERLRAVVLGALVLAVALPATATATAAAQSAAARSKDAWATSKNKPAATRNGARPQVAPRRFRALTVDRAQLAGVLAGAPRERTRAARTEPLTISLPAPDGGFQRFAVQRSSVMDAATAAEHPEIATYSGTGIDERGASVRLDLTPLGFHASVRGPDGSWYVDPYYQRDQSLYVSYRREDLADPHGRFAESDVPDAPGRDEGDHQGGRARADGPPAPLRTYRLALASDPAYATYHGAANVTAAKVTLVNRVNQIYEDDLGIHLALVNPSDVLNLDTEAEMTGSGGPCGAAPCFTDEQAAGCDGPTLDRTHIAIGQLVGASNYDVGHVAMGIDSGGRAYLGVAGADFKGGGCTGVDQPTGDLFAVDYVAHELGHQFGAEHTFNGIDGACEGNLGGPSVEPGSGVTVMAYAGICGSDDLQEHSDPYFSQRSIGEITTYVGSSLPALTEIQTVSLTAFSGSDSFRLSYNGVQSALITRGSNYTPAGIAAALKTIPALANATIFVDRWDGLAGALDSTGFGVFFGGTLGDSDVLPLTLVGEPGFVGETDRGGPARNGGTVTNTGNRAPVVETPAAFTIPVRTPFALTGSATDADNDTLTYLWEQNDAGDGASLLEAPKTSGPLFRVFGTAADVSGPDSLLSPSPGQNAAPTTPTRVFPDLAQIAAGNTNAATGACPAADVDCFSEYLPTSAYSNPLHFRLTARDNHAGGGGVAHDDTTLTLAPSAGPFRVTSQAAPGTVEAGAPYTVNWSVANTSAAPVSVANVKITMSTDGGLTFPKLVIPKTPNDGSQVVRLPNANTAGARYRVEALGNVFFDMNHSNFTITPGAPVTSSPGSASAQYSDPLGAPPAISATDENSPGSALTGQAVGLPAGLTLSAGPPSPGGAPGSRTFTVTGVTSAAPGTYPVEVTVLDDANHGGVAYFDVVVGAEDATASYSGEASVTGAAGAAQAPVNLAFAVTEAADGTPGDVSTATVTFKEGATTLCAARPVVAGSATCAASLSTGAIHHIDAVIGGRYAGSGAGDVEVEATPPVTPPPPPPVAPPPPPPPVAPPPPPVVDPAMQLAPNLASVARRVRLSATGRVSFVLRCRTVVQGLGSGRCAGTLKLTARVGGRRRTIGSATFNFPRTSRRTVRVAISAATRRRLKTATTATLTVSVKNTASATRKATKTVTVLKPRRR